MFEYSDKGHMIVGLRIPRLTAEAYSNAVEDREDTLSHTGQSPGAWLVAAVARAELTQLHESAAELGLTSLPENVVIEPI